MKETDGIIRAVIKGPGQGFPPGYFENDSKTRSIGNHRSWKKREPKELPSHSISYLPVASTNVKSWNHNDIFALSIIMNITRVRKWEKWITNWDEMILTWISTGITTLFLV